MNPLKTISLWSGEILITFLAGLILLLIIVMGYYTWSGNWGLAFGLLPITLMVMALLAVLIAGPLVLPKEKKQ